MRKIILYLAIIIISTSSLLSCKKNSDEYIAPTIIGQWNLERTVTWTDIGLGLVKDTVNYQPGSYANFASDGFVYYKIIDSTTWYDTASYSINGNNIIFNWINAGGYSDTLHIQTITSNNVILNNLTHPFGETRQYWEFLSR